MEQKNRPGLILLHWIRTQELTLERKEKEHVRSWTCFRSDPGHGIPGQHT